MKVVIVPEDPVLDQYILKPIVEHLMSDLGRPARVEVLRDPRVRGVSQALNREFVKRVIDENPMVDLFLLIVDRDGDLKRGSLARAREAEHSGRLLVALAVEEVEVWMLALHREALGTSWRTIRGEADPKEAYAHPFLARFARPGSLGGGRVAAMRELGGSWRGLLDVCPELAELKSRVEALVGHQK